MTDWNSPATPPTDIGQNYQVLCRVLDNAISLHPRSAHCALSTGDHAAGDLFVSVGWPDENGHAESGWYVAGWDMTQDCWTDARRYQVLGWLPLADPGPCPTPAIMTDAEFADLQDANPDATTPEEAREQNAADQRTTGTQIHE